MQTNRTILGLGTNLGDRLQNIRAAMGSLAAIGTIRRTSLLYETPPAYITDQPPFLNCALQLDTALSPEELLAAAEKIMAEMGRVRDVRYGPRVIDIDILFYEDLCLEQSDLVIPHRLLAERSFVLGPLQDMVPDWVHPTLGKTIQTLWNELDDHAILPVTPVAGELWPWGPKSYIMGIVNVTPDSFSGDGLIQNKGDHIQRIVEQAQQFAALGADLLDVGGQSTRPGHELVSIDEELARVVPAIRAIRQSVDLPISVDTFRWEVAAEALNAGAHLLNDIWGLGYARQIAMLAADYDVPLVLMHNRMATGYADELQIKPGPAYEYNDVALDVCQELNQRLEMAHDLGVPRWNLISDPGIGFGKSQEQQLDLINRLDHLKTLQYPILFGASRKSFIGKLLGGLPPDERVEGTLAANVLAIVRGADIIRVHDVDEAVKAAKIADAICRGNFTRVCN